MSTSSPRHLLLVGSSPAQLNAVLPALAGLTCTIRQATDYHAIGQVLAEGPIDVLVFCGAPASLSAKRLLPSLVERAGAPELIISLPDAAEAAALAEIFGGRAAPFPPAAEVFQTCLQSAGQPRELRVRTHSRWRLYNPADLHLAGGAFPALILNVSMGGAMVLSNVAVTAGAMVSVSTKHAGGEFTLAGHVRHVYMNFPVPVEIYESAPLLEKSDPMLFGIEFISHSRPQAEKLCAALADAPLSMPFSALCIPGVPRGLASVFETYGVTVHTAPALPPDFTETPSMVIADLATCALDEIAALRRLAKKAVFIGIATRPLSEAPRTELASSLPAVFVLPFQADTLVEAVERFFRPVHRRFPRLEVPFSAVLHGADGRNLAADGVNLSLTGMAADLDAPLAVGAAVSGRLSAENAVDTAGFAGKVIYCRPQGGRFRAGIHLEIDRKSVKSYLEFLSSLMHRDMVVRWRRQAERGPEIDT